MHIKKLIVAILLLTSYSLTAQRHVVVWMQDYDIENKSLYWNMKYGLKKFITWNKVDEYHYFNKEKNVTLSVNLIPDSIWMNPQPFIDTISKRNDSTLYILVGHNALFGMDTVYGKYENCSQNMLLGCITDSYPWYCLDNTLVNTTDFMAPEGYVTWSAIQGWTNKLDVYAARKQIAIEYARYQSISLNKAIELFNGKNYFK